jgi:hypothetical protein
VIGLEQGAIGTTSQVREPQGSKRVLNATKLTTTEIRSMPTTREGAALLKRSGQVGDTGKHKIPVLMIVKVGANTKPSRERHLLLKLVTCLLYDYF